MRIVPAVMLAILLASPGASFGQPPAQPPAPPGGYVELNLIGTSRAVSGPRDFRSRFITFGEAASERATYPKASNVTLLPAIDVGGGYIVGPLGIGLNISRTSFEDAASLGTTIPHPNVLNTLGTAEGATGRPLTRHETAISAVITAFPLRTSRAELRFFGGPTYFRIKAEMISSVTYSQSSSVTPLSNTITILGFTTEDATSGGLGFHLGSDFTYFFTKTIGVRGGIRYSHGQVTVKEEPLSRLSQELAVGDTAVFLGARFRFGR